MKKFNGFYRAKVVDNVDPLKAGRCKLRVIGVHTQSSIKGTTDGIPDTELPFAEQVKFSGNIFSVPEKNTYVWCFFENGDFMKPVYFGNMPLQNDFGSTFTEGDISLEATNKITIKNNLADIKDILSDIQEILLNLVTAGNMIGNLGAPVIYSQVGIDLPKTTTLLTKINNLLK